LQLFVKIN